MKNSNKRYQILINLAESAIGRKETVGLLNEAAKINKKRPTYRVKLVNS